jgi:predicted protein tyrosine phosphatase
MKLLFICNQGKNRSKTAALLFGNTHKTKSGGLFNENPVKSSQLCWADIIIVMESFQRKIIAEKFPGVYLKKKIISLDIPDMYSYNQPELINQIKQKSLDLF